MQAVELVSRAAAVGVGATLVMDGWALLLKRFGVPSLDFALLGRYLGHLPEGTLRHGSIARAAPVPHERLLGYGAHYAIGVSFALLLVLALGPSWLLTPSLLPALGVGVVTVVAPLFVLQPALGAGIASSKTPRPLFNSVKSLVTHVVFGVGLYLAASACAWLMPGRS